MRNRLQHERVVVREMLVGHGAEYSTSAAMRLIVNAGRTFGLEDVQRGRNDPFRGALPLTGASYAGRHG